METAGGLVAVVLLVMVNGFFVAAEFALVTVRRTRVEQLVTEGRLGAPALRNAIAHLDSYIAACQLGITIASLGLGWIGEPALASLLEPTVGEVGGHAAGVAVTFLLITSLLVVAGELTPKGLALQSPERTALAVAPPLRLFHLVFRPFVWLLNEGGWAFARIFGIHRSAESSAIGMEELRLVLESSGQAGVIPENQQFLLDRVLRFDTLTVGSVMIPRTEMVALPVRTSVAEARAVVAEHRHSRYPVYRNDLDEVIGILHVRDLMLARHEHASVEPLLRSTFHVPEQTTVTQLLAEMRRRRAHFAIAVDEYGGTEGIVTLEDVLEEIVGELQDEFETPERRPQRRPGGALRLDGLDPADTLTELLGIEIEPGRYNTVAGYLLDRVGDIPRAGDEIDIDRHRFRVLEMDDLRIAQVEVSPRATEPGPGAPPSTAAPSPSAGDARGGGTPAGGEPRR